MNNQEDLLQSPAGKHWVKIGVRNHHGFVIPIFSMHSRESCGIGEFFDLLPLLPWLKNLGMDIIQTLPINDTGREASPYSALSAYAINPLFLSLSRLPNISHYPSLVEKLAPMQALNSFKKISYPIVQNLKTDFLLEYFYLAFSDFSNTSDYLQFLKDNAKWLEGYALFKSLKIAHAWHCWEDWEPELKDINEEKYQALVKQHPDQVSFHSFVQYLCFLQWKDVKNEANKNRILLKGDIPILINRDSADVWLNRRLFLMDESTGAPPDMYAEEGQNWGFPIFNWPEIEKDDYAWWRERLRVASELYDIYRIDHVVGFFRIWAIKVGDIARNGRFLPENSAEWIGHGKKIMEVMLKSSHMLPIAEDLGTVLPEFRACLASLGICGTKVMRWERKWHEEGQPFIDPAEYPSLSMTTVSTHDSETLQLWWKNQYEEAQKFAQFKRWEYSPILSKEQQKAILRDSHHSGSLFHINLLQEYLTLLPEMSWPNLEDERINVPGVVSDNNWSYRFRPSVEEIVNSAPLRQLILEIRKFEITS